MVWAERPSSCPLPGKAREGERVCIRRSKSPSLARLERGIEGEKRARPGLSGCTWSERKRSPTDVSDVVERGLGRMARFRRLACDHALPFGESKAR